MARYVCEYGHKDPKDPAKPLVHPSHRFCDAWVRAQSEAKRPPPAPAAAPPTPTEPGAPAPAAPGRAQIGGTGFSIGYSTASRVGLTAADAEVALEWELTEEQSERFWSAGFGLLGTILNGILRLLKVKELPSDTFTLDEGQRYVFRQGMRGFTTTIVQKVFRAKTPADADKVIAAINGIAGFGGLAFKIIVHLVTEVPKSPYWGKLKERFAAGRGRLLNRGPAERSEEKGAAAPAAAPTIGGAPALPPATPTVRAYGGPAGAPA